MMNCIGTVPHEWGMNVLHLWGAKAVSDKMKQPINQIHRAHVTILSQGYWKMEAERLSVVNHSTEWAMYWKEEFEASKERGVAQADLVVSKLSIAIEFPSRIG